MSDQYARIENLAIKATWVFPVHVPVHRCRSLRWGVATRVENNCDAGGANYRVHYLYKNPRGQLWWKKTFRTHWDSFKEALEAAEKAEGSYFPAKFDSRSKRVQDADTGEE